ncbi:hypothetical protein ILUMI_17612, partial [Ignelater luminosus]
VKSNMPQFSKRKTDKRIFTEEIMKEAIVKVLEDGTIRFVAKQMDLKFQTLARYQQVTADVSVLSPFQTFYKPDFLSNEVTNRSNPELYNISEQSNLASSSNQQSSTPSTSNIISPSTPGTPARKTNLTPSSR